jgi:hypothetical protein
MRSKMQPKNARFQFKTYVFLFISKILRLKGMVPEQKYNNLVVFLVAMLLNAMDSVNC